MTIIADPGTVKADIKAAIAFAKAWPGPVTHLCFIHPDSGKIVGRSFEKSDPQYDNRLRAHTEKATAAGLGAYFYANGLSVLLDNKPGRIKATEKQTNILYAFHCDADVDKSVTDPAAFDIAKADLLERIKADPLPPTVIIDSGNGFGLFWLLEKPIKLTAENREKMKAVNVMLRDRFGGDNCQDLAHVMRMPGTVNFPNAKKRARNRAAVLARVVEDDRVLNIYTVEQFPVTAAVPVEPPAEPDLIDVPDKVDLSKLDPEFLEFIKTGKSDRTYGDGSRSSATYTVACELRRLGFSDGDIVSVIIDPDYAIADHILDQKQREPEAQAARVIADMNRKGVTYTHSPDAAELTSDPVEPLTGDEPPPKEKRVTINYVPSDMPDVIDKTQAALNADPKHDPIFQRGPKLVRLNMNVTDDPADVDAPIRRKRGSLIIREVEDAYMKLRLAQSIIYVTKRKEAGRPKAGEKPKWKSAAMAVPSDVVSQLIAAETMWRVKYLEGIIEAPTIRLDGTILSKPGYDAETGLWFDDRNMPVLPQFKDEPTKEDALAALAVLKDVIDEFPFEDDTSQSVALALILTAMVRRVLPIAPGFMLDAPGQSNGKTLLADLVATIATGREAGAAQWGGESEEQRKSIGSILMAGDSVVNFDNVTVPIGGAAICSVITSAGEFKDRILSTNLRMNVPTCTTWMWSGNNMTVKDDMATRVLKCRLDAKCEFPDQREFRRNDLIGYAKANRPALIHAALTIIRAHVVAGKPGAAMVRDRFPVWDHMVAGALMWLGEPNPCASRSGVIADDPVREVRQRVMQTWAEVVGYDKWITATELQRIGTLMDVVGEVEGGGRNSPNSIAAKLKTFEGVIINGDLIVRDAGDRHRATRWMLKDFLSPPDIERAARPQ